MSLEARVAALETEVFGAASPDAETEAGGRAFGAQDTAPPTIAGTEPESSEPSTEPSTPSTSSEPTPTVSPTQPDVSPTVSTPAAPDTSSL